MKKLLVLGAAVFVALVAFATVDAYACDDWCDYIDYGEGQHGWACLTGCQEDCGEECEATTQDCVRFLCTEPVVALDAFGTPTLVIETCVIPDDPDAVVVSPVEVVVEEAPKE